MPQADRLLVETFKRGAQFHSVWYAFAGRNAHQTLGIILTRRMEAAGLGPLGFVANDYALMIWALDPVEDPGSLLDQGDLREALDTWFSENMVMKRTFRIPARVAGLISQNQPGQRKSGRQATFSTDILYDTLRRYDPDHLMLQITRDEAMRGMVDFDRIEELTDRIKGRVDHVAAPHVTPLSAPLILEVGRVPVKGEAERRLLDEEIGALLREAKIGQ